MIQNFCNYLLWIKNKLGAAAFSVQQPPSLFFIPLQPRPAGQLQDGQGDGSQDALEQQERCEPFGISVVSDSCDPQGSHDGPSRRHDAIGETVPELECLDGHLPGDPREICQRHHQGHHRRSLPGSGRDEQIDEQVGPEHQDGADHRSEAPDGNGKVIDDGIQDMPVFQDDGDPIGEGNDEARIEHGLAPFQEGFGSAVHSQPQDSALDEHGQEHDGGDLLVPPFGEHGSGHDGNDGQDHHT